MGFTFHSPSPEQIRAENEARERERIRKAARSRLAAWWEDRGCWELIIVAVMVVWIIGVGLAFVGLMTLTT